MANDGNAPQINTFFTPKQQKAAEEIRQYVVENDGYYPSLGDNFAYDSGRLYNGREDFIKHFNDPSESVNNSVFNFIDLNADGVIDEGEFTAVSGLDEDKESISWEDVDILTQGILRVTSEHNDVPISNSRNNSSNLSQSQQKNKDLFENVSQEIYMDFALKAYRGMHENANEKYEYQLKNEGAVDDFYNYLKDNKSSFMPGYTQGEVEFEIDRTAINIEILEYMAKVESNDSNITDSDERLKVYQDWMKQDFMHIMNSDKYSLQEKMETLSHYTGSEELALDIINNYCTYQFPTRGFSISKAEETNKFGNTRYVFVEQNGEYLREFSNYPSELGFFSTLEFQRYMNGIVDDMAPKNFETAFSYLTGIDFGYEDYVDLSQNSSNYSISSSIYEKARNDEENLNQKGFEETLAYFNEKYGSEEQAIQAFNKYYSNLLGNFDDVYKNRSGNHPLNNSDGDRLTSLNAIKNSDGEVEFVMNFASSSTSEEFETRYSLSDLSSENSEQMEALLSKINGITYDERIKSKIVDYCCKETIGKSISELELDFYTSVGKMYGQQIKSQELVDWYINDMDTYAERYTERLEILANIVTTPLMGSSGKVGTFCIELFLNSIPFLENHIKQVNLDTNDISYEDEKNEYEANMADVQSKIDSLERDALKKMLLRKTVNFVVYSEDLREKFDSLWDDFETYKGYYEEIQSMLSGNDEVEDVAEFMLSEVYDLISNLNYDDSSLFGELNSS